MSRYSGAKLPGVFRRNSVFIGQVATLVSGRAGAGLVAFLLMPVVARLFTPADYGVAVFFLAVAEPVSVLATLRFEGAIVLPKANEQALRLAWAAFLSALTAVAVLWLAGLGLFAAGLPLPLADRLGPWLWVLPVAVFATALLRIVNNLLLRWQKFKAVAGADVTQTTTTAGSRILFGALAGSSVGGLVLGHFVGIGAKLAVLARGAWSDLRDAFRRPALADIRDSAREYRDFPLYELPAGFLQSFSKAVVLLVLGILYAPAILGFFAMAQRVVSVPSNMMGTAVRQTYLRRASELHNEGRAISGALAKTTLTLAAIGILPTVILVMYGEPLLAWFLGEDWRVAGTYAEVIAFMLFSAWVTVPSTATLVLLRRQRLRLIFQAIGAAAQMTVLAVAYVLSAEPLQTITAFIAVRVSLNALILVVTWRLAALDTASLRRSA